MDIDFLLFLQNIREATGGIFNALAIQISDLSYGIFIWLIACVFFWSVNKRVGSTLFLNVGVSRFLMQFLKLTFCVYRPYVRSAALTPLEEASGYSFPSGHSVTAAANYGTLARCYRKYRGIALFFVMMILLTMLSRNYIGVHTPQDVLVGALLGGIVVLFAPKLWGWAERDSGRDRALLIGGLLLTAAFLLYISLKSYPTDFVDGALIVDPAKMVKDGYKDAGRFLGLTLGWFVERRYVRFSLDVPMRQRVMRSLIGGMLLILFDKLLIPAIAGQLGAWGYFVMMAAELFTLIAAYPMLFQALERRKAIRSA